MIRKVVINIRRIEEVSWEGKVIFFIVDLVSLKFKGVIWCINLVGS